MQKAMSFNDTAIVYVKGSAYRIHFWYMSKDDAINIMNNSNLANKMGALQKMFLLYIKMSECNSVECNSTDLTYYQKHKCMILNRTHDYYENDK